MRTMVTLAAGFAAFFMFATANAEEGWPGELSGQVGVASDYTFRGVSLNGEDVSLNAMLRWDFEDWYVSVSGNTANFGAGSSLQFDYAVGKAFQVFDQVVEAGAVFRQFPNISTPGVDLNFFELYAQSDFELAGATVTPSLVYSWDYFDSGATLWRPAVDVEYPVSFGEREFAFGVAVGYNELEDSAVNPGFQDYTDWNVSVSTDVGPFVAEISYVDTVDFTSTLGPLSDGRTVFSLSKSF